MERSITFYDVGANHGRYAWLISEANPDAAVIAFEPDPDNIELLHMTVSNSDLKNVRIEGVALSDKAGRVSFHQDSHTSATGMISTGETPWVEKYLGHATSTIDIQRETLDSFIIENVSVVLHISIPEELYQDEVYIKLQNHGSDKLITVFGSLFNNEFANMINSSSGTAPIRLMMFD